MRAFSVLVVASLAGWAGMTLRPPSQGLPATCGEVSLWVLWQVTRQTTDLRATAGLIFWGVGMILAMMAPGLFRPVAHIISQSMPRRTASLMLAFFMAYTTVWLPVVALLMLTSGAVLFNWSSGPLAVLPGLLVWYGWACTPIHQQGLNRGHVLRPLRSFSGAFHDVLGLGVQHGLWCVVSCWPLMLLPALSAGFSGPVMVVCSVAGALMRALPPRAARWRISGLLPLGQALQVSCLWSMRRARSVWRASMASLAARRPGATTW